MRDKFIIFLLSVIMFFNLIDIIADIQLGTPKWHYFAEALLVIGSAIAALSLIAELRSRNKKLESLKLDLLNSHSSISKLSEEMRLARSAYSEVIHKQFIDWQLTESEQKVAMLMLKGLNFKEIGAVRATKEKTIRQQASNIYSKANVAGRHEFSAWFLEDFLTH